MINTSVPVNGWSKTEKKRNNTTWNNITQVLELLLPPCQKYLLYCSHESEASSFPKVTAFCLQTMKIFLCLSVAVLTLGITAAEDKKDAAATERPRTFRRLIPADVLRGTYSAYLRLHHAWKNSHQNLHVLISYIQTCSNCWHVRDLYNEYYRNSGWITFIYSTLV